MKRVSVTPRPFYTPEEDAIIADLRSKRVPYEQIGRRLGRSAKSVMARRELLDLPPTEFWQEDEKSLFEAMWRAGRPVKEIEDRLHRSKHAIHNMRRVMDLPPRQNPPLFGPWSRTPKRVKELEPA